MWIETAQRHADVCHHGDLTEVRCTCCGRPLKGKLRLLELDQRTNTYHDDGGVPAEKSQGAFPFGLSCAKRKIAQHRAR